MQPCTNVAKNATNTQGTWERPRQVFASRYSLQRKNGSVYMGLYVYNKIEFGNLQ